ncbi:hypothetical protein HMPREF9056_02095 [Actinomyces sp. oral taxon 170 str. F0386]|nr:hypothetical protein HMPREF9056_02095 [Actinomyces sp. oral taxon 170 str. F0386]
MKAMKDPWTQGMKTGRRGGPNEYPHERGTGRPGVLRGPP